jgi:hypothetical protein
MSEYVLLDELEADRAEEQSLQLDQRWCLGLKQERDRRRERASNDHEIK